MKLIDNLKGFTKRLNIFVGAYGSGKTEICVNIASRLAMEGKIVNLADLDIANPYFRSREVQNYLRQNGVNPVVPGGDVQFSDLPVILPQISGMLKPSGEDYSIFDVGGDTTGAKVLASIKDGINGDDYNLFQVVNTNRPFTSTVEGCIKMQQMLQDTSGLKVSGFIFNSHLMDFTDENVIIDALEIATQLVNITNIEITYFSLMETLMNIDKIVQHINYPLLLLQRKMLPPWLIQNSEKSWPIMGNR
ncbi:MAG: ATP-binding protein [Deltaproteobacteria bacterium]|nr:ATP-binding protein [Deltaproteobacteria bacterium]